MGQAIRLWVLGAVLCASTVIALAGQASGGQEPPPIACTEIGCASEAAVTLKRLPADARRARVCVAGRCGRTQRLYRSRYGDLVVAALPKAKRREGAFVRVTVQVFDEDGRVLARAHRRAKVRRTQPNGEDCPPVCFQVSLRYRGDTGQLRP